MVVYILQDFIGPLLSILLWIGVVNYSGSIQSGWSIERIVSYFLVTTFLNLSVNHYVEIGVGYEHIGQGEIAQVLTKPLSYHRYVFVTETGWKTVRLFLSLIPFTALVFLFRRYINVYVSLNQVVVAVLFSVIAYFLIFLFKFLVGMTAFWVTEINGILHASWAIQAVFAGRLIPFDFLPRWLQTVSEWLPFRFFFYVPANTLLTSVPTDQIARDGVIALAWVIFFGVINVLMLKRGLRRFTDTRG